MESITKFFDGKNHVVWDWNGTLLNDLDLCVEIIGEILSDHGLETVCRDMYRKVFRFPVKQYYEDVGFDLEALEFETLSYQFVDKYNKRVRSCDVFPGVIQMLEELKERGVRCSILSAAHQEDLVALLKHYQLDGFFEQVFGLDNHHAACKIERGRQLISTGNHDLSQTIMVGDTDHDWEVAQALGIDILLLGDGHQCPTRLSAVHDKVVHSRFQ